MLDLDRMTDDLDRGCCFHMYLGFNISDIFQKADHDERESPDEERKTSDAESESSDAETSAGHPYVNPFGGIHAAELAQADMERDCAEACFHARWLKKHCREELTAWELRTGM